ncbi:hypothetical protein FD754_012585, partial [Muntiacus muntjak]
DILEPSAGVRPYAVVRTMEAKPDVNPEKKKFAIPQIIITTPSKETVISYGSMGMQEQRTIRERAEQGPYSRHRNPSTVDAYSIQTTE